MRVWLDVVAALRTGRKAAEKVVIDLRDPKVREEFLMAEMMKANNKMMEGKRSKWRGMEEGRGRGRGEERGRGRGSLGGGGGEGVWGGGEEEQVEGEGRRRGGEEGEGVWEAWEEGAREHGGGGGIQ